VSNTADVIIIGGGVQGASLAFHLVQRGVKATVLEKQFVGAGATGRSMEHRGMSGTDPSTAFDRHRTWSRARDRSAVPRPDEDRLIISSARWAGDGSARAEVANFGWRSRITDRPDST